MEIRRYLAILRRWAVLVVLIVAAALAAGWAIVPRGHTYSATSIVYVGQRTINIAPAGGQVSGDYAAGLDRLISTFTAMVPPRGSPKPRSRSAHVARGSDGVVANTTAKQVPQTNLITITYTDSDPHVAQAVDGAVRDRARRCHPHRRFGQHVDRAVAVGVSARVTADRSEPQGHRAATSSLPDSSV